MSSVPFEKCSAANVGTSSICMIGNKGDVDGSEFWGDYANDGEETLKACNYV